MQPAEIAKVLLKQFGSKQWIWTSDSPWNSNEHCLTTGAYAASRFDEPSRAAFCDEVRKVTGKNKDVTLINSEMTWPEVKAVLLKIAGRK